MRRLLIAVVLLAPLLLLSQAPINRFSKGGGQDGQGWSWNAENARWEMHFFGPSVPSSVYTSSFLARGFNHLSMLFDDVSSTANCTNVTTTSTEPVVERCQVSTANTWGNIVGRLKFRVGNGTRFFTYAGISSTTTGCFLFGVTSATSFSGSSCDPLGDYAAFTIDNASQTTWQCTTRDNTTTSSTDSLVTADTSLHTFDIVEATSTWDFYIDGTQVCSKATNLPRSGEMLVVAQAVKASGLTVSFRMNVTNTQARLRP